MPPKCLSYMKTLSFLLIKYALIILIIMLGILIKENIIVTCLYNISTGIKVYSWARLVVTFKNMCLEMHLYCKGLKAENYSAPLFEKLECFQNPQQRII